MTPSPKRSQSTESISTRGSDRWIGDASTYEESVDPLASPDPKFEMEDYASVAESKISMMSVDEIFEPADHYTDEGSWRSTKSWFQKRRIKIVVATIVLTLIAVTVGSVYAHNSRAAQSIASADSKPPNQKPNKRPNRKPNRKGTPSPTITSSPTRSPAATPPPRPDKPKDPCTNYSKRFIYKDNGDSTSCENIRNLERDKRKKRCEKYDIVSTFCPEVCLSECSRTEPPTQEPTRTFEPTQEPTKTFEPTEGPTKTYFPTQDPTDTYFPTVEPTGEDDFGIGSDDGLGI